MTHEFLVLLVPFVVLLLRSIPPRGRSAAIVVFALASTGCDGCSPASNPGPLRPDENTRFHVTDRLGSSALVLDHDGTVIARGAHRPFGEPWVEWQETGARAPEYGFTGGEHESVAGSITIGIRQYLPALGRWASPDPLFVHEPEQLQARPGERNLYRYAANNPIAFTDPTGTSVWTKLGKVAVKVYKGGTAAAAFVETARDVNTLVSPNSTVVERTWAAVSLASEALPVGVHDVKAIRAATRQTSAAVTGTLSKIGRSAKAKPRAPSTPRGTWEPNGRFVGEPNGTVVDTAKTAPGRYIQPDRSATDVLQKTPHTMNGQPSYSHTHAARYNTSPKDGQQYFNGLNRDPQPASAGDVQNITSGAAQPSRRKGR